MLAELSAEAVEESAFFPDDPHAESAKTEAARSIVTTVLFIILVTCLLSLWLTDRFSLLHSLPIDDLLSGTTRRS